jgi:exodeoxyribonuclease VII small subunit
MPAKRKESPVDVAESFEAAADELEEITRRLEQEPTSLTHLLEDFERGQSLLSYCQNTLKSARKRLDLVEAKLQAEAFDDESDDSPEDVAATNDDDVRLF